MGVALGSGVNHFHVHGRIHNMTDRFVIVGGDAAGMSAASKAKRADPEREVVVFERTGWASFGACGIPYYVEGIIEELDDLVVVDQQHIEERGIDLRRNHDVVGLDPERKTVTVETGAGRTEFEYDTLLLATGGRATMPDVEGIEAGGIFGIRNLEAGRALRHYISHDDPPTRDSTTRATSGGEIPARVSASPDTNATSKSTADDSRADESRVDDSRGVDPLPADYESRLRSYVQEIDPETAAVVGGNKIGIEFAEAFATHDLDVSIIEAGRQILPTFGTEAAGIAENHIREAGVDVHLDASLRGFQTTEGRVRAVETDDGEIDADIVLIDIGVDPVVELATSAGVELGRTGGIRTDRSAGRRCLRFTRRVIVRKSTT